MAKCTRKIRIAVTVKGNNLIANSSPRDFVSSKDRRSSDNRKRAQIRNFRREKEYLRSKILEGANLVIHSISKCTYMCMRNLAG